MKRSILSLVMVFSLLALCYSCSWPFQSTSIRIGRDPNWYPLNLRGRESNVLAFSDEITTHITDEADLNVKLLDTTWSETVEGLHENLFDAVLSPLMPNPRNQDVYKFSEPYFHTGPVLIVLDESEIHSLDDLNTQELFVQRGVSFSAAVQRFPALNISPLDNPIDAIEELIAGKTEGVVLEAVQAHAITQGLYRHRVRTVMPPFTQEGLRLITLKDDKLGLVESFNKGLKATRESGLYYQLTRKWNVSLKKWEGP